MARDRRRSAERERRRRARATCCSCSRLPSLDALSVSRPLLAHVIARVVCACAWLGVSRCSTSIPRRPVVRVYQEAHLSARATLFVVVIVRSSSRVWRRVAHSLAPPSYDDDGRRLVTPTAALRAIARTPCRRAHDVVAPRMPRELRRHGVEQEHHGGRQARGRNAPAVAQRHSRATATTTTTTGVPTRVRLQHAPQATAIASAAAPLRRVALAVLVRAPPCGHAPPAFAAAPPSPPPPVPARTGPTSPPRPAPAPAAASLAVRPLRHGLVGLSCECAVLVAAAREPVSVRRGAAQQARCVVASWRLRGCCWGRGGERALSFSFSLRFPSLAGNMPTVAASLAPDTAR